MKVTPLDFSRLKVLPLKDRKSMGVLDEILISPDSAAPGLSTRNEELVQACMDAVRKARSRDAAVILMYGAHLVKNGGAAVINELLRQGWITHVATNGAGTIHDWEYAWFGKSTESVQQNVATGTFGTWDETGRNIHLALLAGLLRDEGYGVALGRFIEQGGADFPLADELRRHIRDNPDAPGTAVRAEVLRVMREAGLPGGRISLEHRWKYGSILGTAFRHGVPVTVHPGIGYDIISCHPLFNGAVLGRAAELDFKLFGGSVDHLDGGVVLSVGSAIMAPQVFEKSLSCVHNLRFQTNRPAVKDHSFFIVDLQDGGNWDWTRGEPPKDNAAYYLRFCKSFSRMGGTMHYVQCDNVAFMHNLLARLRNVESLQR